MEINRKVSIMKNKNIRNISFENGEKHIIAGPCAVESKEQLDTILSFLSELGINIIRAGIFKPRTNPDSFRGLGEKGLEYLIQLCSKYNLRFVSELLSIEQVEKYADSMDIIQVGTRNMYNYPLLEALGRKKNTIFLKRAFSATYNEWEMASRYIMKEGNNNIVLVERGIRSFETATRNTLDITAVPYMKSKTKLPVIVDPSHAAGLRELVPSLSKAAISAGADGLLIEVHNEPEKALSDGRQSLNFEDFSALYKEIKGMIK